MARTALPRLAGPWAAATAGVVLLLGATRVAAVDRASALPLEAFPRETVVVETRASFRRPVFVAWRAETPAMREQGLMFVEKGEMRPDQAMIFVYEPPQPVAMWMKNTYLSLDMLFVDAAGCVVNVAERARPGSLANIDSRGPVVLVVELLAGTAARLGIQPGDRVLRPDARWPAPPLKACRGT